MHIDVCVNQVCSSYFYDNVEKSMRVAKNCCVAPVKRLYMSTSECYKQDEVRSLTLVEGQASKLCCVSEGCYPNPEMAIYVDRRDISRLFSVRYDTQLEGEAGLRQMRFVTEWHTNDFTVSAEDDGTHVKCIVAVPGLTSNFTSLRLEVTCL